MVLTANQALRVQWVRRDPLGLMAWTVHRAHRVRPGPLVPWVPVVLQARMDLTAHLACRVLLVLPVRWDPRAPQAQTEQTALKVLLVRKVLLDLRARKVRSVRWVCRVPQVTTERTVLRAPLAHRVLSARSAQWVYKAPQA